MTSQDSRRAAWVREFRQACQQIWATREHECETCGAYLPDPAITTYFHHIKHRSQGGGNEPENIMLQCVVCHGAKHGVRVKT